MSAIGLIGGLAAMSASALTHPVDSVRVRMYLYGQMESNVNPTMSLVKHIWEREGLRGFYRGMLYTTTYSQVLRFLPFVKIACCGSHMVLDSKINT